MGHSSVNALMVWLVNYLANSAWQVPLLLLAAMVAARLVARLYPVAAVHWTWVSALVLAMVLPALRMEVWQRLLGGRAAEVAGGQVQVVMMPGTAVTSGRLQLPLMLMAGLLAMYGATVAYFAGRIVWGVWTTRSLRRNAFAVQLADPLPVRWQELCRRLRGTRVVLCESAAVMGPAMVGVHTVLLPAGFIGKVEESDLEAALAHELAHVRRRDYLKNLGYAVLMLPIAYHPRAWMIRGALAESREAVCDAMAAEALDGRRKYARSLLRLAMAIPEGLRGGATAAVGISEGTTLERRVSLMMERGKRLEGATRVAAMAAVMVLSGVAVVSMAGTHVSVRAEESTGKNSKPLQVVPPTNLTLLSQVDPEYPKKGRADHMSGSCILRVIINENGVPTDIHVVKSLRKDFNESALTAVRQWRWKPYIEDAKAVAVETKITITYRIY